MIQHPTHSPCRYHECNRSPARGVIQSSFDPFNHYSLPTPIAHSKADNTTHPQSSGTYTSPFEFNPARLHSNRTHDQLSPGGLRPPCRRPRRSTPTIATSMMARAQSIATMRLTPMVARLPSKATSMLTSVLTRPMTDMSPATTTPLEESMSTATLTSS